MKGCYDAVEVIAKIKKTIPDIQLVMAGFGEIEQIKEKAKKYKVEENILFPGWVRDEEKDRYLKDCSVFFLPSYTEGMPMSILDAMGYGKPIVTTNVGGIPKLVTNGENGYMCDPGDINGFATSISEILTDKEKKKSMGKCSLRIIIDDYSLDKHISSLENVYSNLLFKD